MHSKCCGRFWGHQAKQAFCNQKAKSLVKDKEIITIYAKYPIRYKHEKVWKHRFLKMIEFT